MTQSQAEALSIALSSMMNEKGATGFKLMRNKRMIDDELKDYYKFKNDLFLKYADGENFIDPNSEKGKEFIKEFQPIADLEVSFDFRKLTEDELAQSTLTASQMAILWEWMVEDGKD